VSLEVIVTSEKIDENGATSARSHFPNRVQDQGLGHRRTLRTTVTKAIGLAAKFKNMGMISEPVNEGRGQAFITKDLRPVGKSEIGGNDEGNLFVEGRAELKVQLRPGGGERNETQFIQDNRY
jgi:hypothetical protein